MIKLEDFCVGCVDLGLPCLRNACPNMNVPIHYCDNCGVELEEFEQGEAGETEYCIECRKKLGELEDDE